MLRSDSAIDTEFLAHSAKNGHQAQSYSCHIHGVYEKALSYVGAIEKYVPNCPKALRNCVLNGAIWHDLGKLHPLNQKVLHAAIKALHLPVNHTDAGIAAIIKGDPENIFPAIIIASHHRGLPNLPYGDDDSLCDDDFPRSSDKQCKLNTDRILSDLINLHKQLVSFHANNKEVLEDYFDLPVFLRLALSCLADADHTDTALAYKQISIIEKIPPLMAKERLIRLDQYVGKLNKKQQDERSQLRQEMYTACRNGRITSKFSTCDSPVGSGKTTAIMAHLLQQAAAKNLRRIFVILPYTNIITQAVEVYRKALVLPGEDPKNVVGELHSRADFQNADTRYLTALWQAPIIVTTAVAFFETLSSNRPSALRRLHELPGSIIFIDESHNALPLKYLPLAWHWMNVFADEWNCYWVLASGSLVKFWQLTNFQKLKQCKIEQPHVADLIPQDLKRRLLNYEKNRVRIFSNKKTLSPDELISWVHTFSGPRLLILNTVQNAAVIADLISKKYGRQKVEHLSTALTAEDRAKTIKVITKRLQNSNDNNWTLVATSCVEAGMDFSFAAGFRERASLLSLLQASGRINRHGEAATSQVWDFKLQEHSLLTKNPAIQPSIDILENYFKKQIDITAKLSTESMDQELTLYNATLLKEIEKLLLFENLWKFETIEKDFKVIDSDTVTVVVDESFALLIKENKADWKQLQRHSVSIRKTLVNKLNLKEIIPNIYQWDLQYDTFLGYMKEIVKNLEISEKDI